MGLPVSGRWSQHRQVREKRRRARARWSGVGVDAYGYTYGCSCIVGGSLGERLNGQQYLESRISGCGMQHPRYQTSRNPLNLPQLPRNAYGPLGAAGSLFFPERLIPNYEVVLHPKYYNRTEELADILVRHTEGWAGEPGNRQDGFCTLRDRRLNTFLPLQPVVDHHAWVFSAVGRKDGVTTDDDWE